MNAATVLSLAAGSVQLVLAGLALAFAMAPGWKHLRVFAGIALSGVAFSLCSSVFAWTGVSAETVVWAGRVNLAVAFIHVALWVRYIPLQYGEELGPRGRRLVQFLFGAAALCLTPLVVSDATRAQSVVWAKTVYRVAEITPVAEWLLLAMPLSLLVPAHAFVRKAREGVVGSFVHVAGFTVLIGATTHDVFVVGEVFNNVYLGVVGICAAMLSVCWEVALRVIRDATHLHRLSADLTAQVEERTTELHQARDRLARTERLAALGQLSASVGHEINNPLSYIMGNLDYIRGELNAEGGLGGPLKDALVEAFTGAERIRRIVSELRLFSRTPLSDEGEVLDIHAVLQASVKLLEGALNRSVHVETDYMAVACVRADATKLSQVFLNLLTNAVQASSEHATGDSEPSVIVRTSSLSNARVCVEILDNGPGVSADEQERVFEPFFSTKGADQGTGLGLFISLGIVSSLGGNIALLNRVGGGTCARVELLGCEEEITRPKSSRPPMSHVVSCSEGQRLLIVDDDVLVARSLARQLRSYEVDVVGGGQHALERLSEGSEHYDWILCDLMMPGVTGMDVYERIVAQRPEMADRFVFISGGGATERCRKFSEEHEERVIPKPIDPQKLGSLLNREVAERSQTVNWS